ncbi:MAG: TonB-dependent receptor domain-containing protein [Sphingomicrobium sp.]|nr:TonB-dependent receptor [Sphingomonadales bacterium]
MSNRYLKGSLLATTVIVGMVITGPASAQTVQEKQPTSTTAPGTPAAGTVDVPAPAANVQPVTQTTSANGASGSGQDIIVTGSILRRATSPSPITRITAETLDRRGVSTIQDAIQTLASNNGPALTNAFTANGAFAAGASAVSLRGLSTNSTLVLFDGLRAAYYPLADDGSRNFVDLNTIPDDIVERIDVLRDGASASYGADAIAGVVNIITKKEFKGFGARAEGGISERGDAAQYRMSATVGAGDLADKGLSAYLSGFYYRSKALYNHDRPYPFNSDDQRRVCAPDANGDPSLCGGDFRQNGFDSTGAFAGVTTAANFLVRPYDPTNTRPLGRYVNLSPCVGTSYTLTAADLAAFTNAPTTVCQADYTNQYAVINPNIQRFGISGRVTARVADKVEAYFEANFLQSSVDYTGFPATVRGVAPTGIVNRQFSTADAAASRAAGSFPIFLPIYVCPRGTTVACTAANGRLNPNNPFAASGQVARLIGRDLESTTFNKTRNRAYRAAFGVSGDITSRINFDVIGTAMHTDLQRLNRGYVYIQHLLDVVNDGSYNFRDPSATPQSVLDYLKPENINNDSSDLYQIQGTVGFRPVDLPGGPLSVGVGGTVFYEAVNSPSGNPDYNGPTQRYFTLNAFGTVGHRTVKAVYGEVIAPIIPEVELRASGRYDSYSSGQSAFSPKVGAILRPIHQLTFRGTYSRGFRIPSFGEANALPTTGYVSNNVSNFTNSFLAQYGCSIATYSTCPIYIRTGSYGQTTLASPNLKPEKSRNLTLSATFDPSRSFSFSVDYFKIKKTGAITQPSNAPALAAYYGNAAVPAGYTVIPDAPDPNFPNAQPRLAFIQAQLINANTIKSSGLDFSALANFTPFNGVKVTSSIEASYILNLSTSFPDGHIERYDGTLGNFNLTAGSGTPKWHGNWQNTFDFGRLIVTGTAYYFDGYNLSATDQGTGYGDGGLNPGYSPTGNNVKSYITVDLNAQFKLNKNFTIYGTVENLFNRLPPIDVVTYGSFDYNPVQGGTGILGRYFKAGAKVNF